MARRSDHRSAADYPRHRKTSALPLPAQICTALMVVIGLILSALATDAHTHAPAIDLRVAAASCHRVAHSELEQSRGHRNPARIPTACPGCNHTVVSVTLARYQQQSSESFRTAWMNAPGRKIRAIRIRQIASGAGSSLKTTNRFSSLPPPERICNKDLLVLSTAFSFSA